MSGAFTIDQRGIAELFSQRTGPIAEVLEREGADAEAEMVRLLSEPGHGRVYARRGGTEIASEPGESPAPLTAVLRGSVSHELHIDRGGVFCAVGSDDPNAVHQEFGTSRMLPRPFMRPVLMRLGG